MMFLESRSWLFNCETEHVMLTSPSFLARLRLRTLMPEDRINREHQPGCTSVFLTLLYARCSPILCPTGVFWSSSATQRFFWRTDVRGVVPRISNVTHRGGLVRMISLPTHERFVAVHGDGNLVLYDGNTGVALASVLVRAARRRARISWMARDVCRYRGETA